jgi:DNA polymerase III subunit epsilon
MILFFDTETTGLFSDRLPLLHPDQPHLVQLAMLLTEDDGEAVMSASFIVDCPYPIPPRASEVHGITNDIAGARGVDLEMAIDTFRHFYRLADILCCHNVKFDIGIMESEISRFNGREIRLPKATFCTMEAASPIVNLPPTERMLAAGFNKPKPPKLEECIRHFFDEDLTGAHDAMIDVTACRRVFFHLKSLETA